MPEFRRDPLHEVWVAFSPERQRRPHDFLAGELKPGVVDPFAAGNEHLTPPEIYAVREGRSAPNGPGWRVRVVPNRYPAMRIEGQLKLVPEGLYDRATGIGAHEVIIETPDSAAPLESLPVSAIAEVLTAYKERMLDLDRDRRFEHIFVFKNVGPVAGASLAHAHSQLVALPVVPLAIEGKLRRAREHYLRKDRSLFSDILHTEKAEGKRIVAENGSFVLFCPYASRFPFEMAIYPKRHEPDYASCGAGELHDLAELLRYAVERLNLVLEHPGYNLLLHTAPLRRPQTERFASARYDYCWHIEIVPRLAALAGFEIGLGAHINAVFPEEAARFLRGEGRS
jgi:UDPglucose--hexose-1-phosphate uridylyltransferase